MPGSAAPLLIWIDAQLPPVLSRWIEDLEHVQAVHVSEIGLLTAEDPEIFEKARSAGAIVMTKDGDFVQLQERRGVPPQTTVRGGKVSTVKCLSGSRIGAATRGAKVPRRRRRTPNRAWRADAESIGALFSKFGTRLPAEMSRQHEALVKRLV